MASEEETQQEDTVQLREHGNMMNRPLVVGVLFESDEWSDHKLGAEISSALKTTLPNITHDVRLINMQQANSVDAALECDVLVSRVFASALNRGHEQALRNMDALIQAIEALRSCSSTNLAPTPMRSTSSLLLPRFTKQASRHRASMLKEHRKNSLPKTKPRSLILA